MIIIKLDLLYFSIRINFLFFTLDPRFRLPPAGRRGLQAVAFTPGANMSYLTNKFSHRKVLMKDKIIMFTHPCSIACNLASPLRKGLK